MRAVLSILKTLHYMASSLRQPSRDDVSLGFSSGAGSIPRASSLAATIRFESPQQKSNPLPVLPKSYSLSCRNAVSLGIADYFGLARSALLRPCVRVCQPETVESFHVPIMPHVNRSVNQELKRIGRSWWYSPHLTPAVVTGALRPFRRLCKGRLSHRLYRDLARERLPI